jgi:two-component system, chemotaxis family, protein-glutamate methylesterase/glutaminase
VAILDAHHGPIAGRPVPGIVALGASAGGLDAFTHVLSTLPADLPVPIVLVQHVAAHHDSRLPDILDRHTPLRVTAATDGARLDAGTVYVAVPDRHLVVTRGRVSLTSTPAVRFARPSIDVLFQSVAQAYRDEALAVVLTGTGTDGAMGAEAVREVGGTVVAQDEATAAFATMPRAATTTGSADLVLPRDAIGPTINDLLARGVAS